jgi:hypothetical protein
MISPIMIIQKKMMPLVCLHYSEISKFFRSENITHHYVRVIMHVWVLQCGDQERN